MGNNSKQQYYTSYYNLDMIISIGYRVNSKKAVKFRQWASKIIKEYIGWEKNTTYTVIKRLIDKGAISREDPGFLCRAEVTKKQVQDIETKALLTKMYNGSLTTFITDYLGDCKLTTEQVIELQRVLNHQL